MSLTSKDGGRQTAAEAAAVLLATPTSALFEAGILSRSFLGCRGVP